ncbi:NYN domain-containing protein [Thermophilibacter provencensis]|uniref:NYN domain-containing protein n=1 Tax=Thermophilibacter provencensis TaxID=1852386 RepID=A0A921GGS1_9ACTN|nr:NYN domain-containing protein [Thermophilibacter provencensis]HJF45614.1 NYN domain-containing protein [Thermophilibacter provencensis]
MPSPEGSRELLVVDGYNVIFKSARYLARMDETVAGDPFEQARDLLVADVAAYAKGRYEPVIVFDAAGNVSPERPDLSKAGVRMVFSRTGESADAVIERLVTEQRLLPRAVTVVTSDRAIRATVGGVPVTRISSDVLVADVNQLAAEYERANAERQTQHMRLEDRIDPAAREKLWRMLRG